MEAFMSLLEKRMLPIANVIQKNRYIMAIRDGFMGIMPLLIIGSLFLLVANLPIPGYTDFLNATLGEYVGVLTYVFDATYNVMALLVVVGIAVSLSKQYNLAPITLIVTALASFILLIPQSILVPVEEGSDILLTVGSVIQTSFLSSSGIFVALISSIVTIEIFNFVVKRNWTIKMPASVPPEVANSFTALYPAFFVLVFWLLFRVGFQISSFGTIQNFVFTIVQAPLMGLGNSLISQLVSEFSTLLFWCFGIHGSSIVGSIMSPIWNTLSSENLTAFQQGSALPNIITTQFRDVFIIAGGTGATMSLIIAVFIHGKSKSLRDLCKLAFPASIFNINEPIIFGVPIILNPVMIIPFVTVPVVLTIITYVTMSLGLVPLTNGIALPWTTPVLVSGLLACGWKGLLLQLVNLFIAYLIYLPFVVVQDKIYLKEERGEENA